MPQPPRSIAAVLSPTSTNAQFDLCAVLAKQGFALARQGKLHEAEAKYAASLQVHPTALAYNGHGAVLSQLGKNDDALEEYGRALQLDPDFADARVVLDRIVLRRRQNEPQTARALEAASETP